MDNVPGIVVLIYIIMIILMVASYWKIFQKAGKPGWAAIIPIYNIIVYLQVVRKPVWWIILLLIPIVNIIFLIIITHRLSVVFGHGAEFTLGILILPFIFLPIIAFGDSKYVGAMNSSNMNSNPMGDNTPMPMNS